MQLFMLKADFRLQVHCSAGQGMENVVNLLSTAGGELLVQIPVDIILYYVTITLIV